LNHHQFRQLYAYNLPTVRAPPIQASPFFPLHAICLSRNSNLFSYCARNSGFHSGGDGLVEAMASGVYVIQAVRAPSGSFHFVLLITFCRAVSQIMSAFMALEHLPTPYSCNTFLPVNQSQVTRDRTQTETRFRWSPFGFYVCNRLVAGVYGMFRFSELLIMHPTVHLACHTPTRFSTTNGIDNVFAVRRRG
ncbi:hypothetical protein K443DRAFT_106886, partial [Laccaria amethystina LaAM-08-1]